MCATVSTLAIDSRNGYAAHSHCLVQPLILLCAHGYNRETAGTRQFWLSLARDSFDKVPFSYILSTGCSQPSDSCSDADWRPAHASNILRQYAACRSSELGVSICYGKANFTWDAEMKCCCSFSCVVCSQAQGYSSPPVQGDLQRVNACCGALPDCFCAR